MEGEALEPTASPQEDYDMMALTIVALNDDVPPEVGQRSSAALHTDQQHPSPRGKGADSQRGIFNRNTNGGKADAQFFLL